MIPRQPIQAVTRRVDKRPNGRTEGARDASGKAVFRARQGAAPVTRGKGHALVVSAVLSVGGGGRDDSGRQTGIAPGRAGGRLRFHPGPAPAPSSGLRRAPPRLLRISLTPHARLHHAHHLRRFPLPGAGSRRTGSAIRRTSGPWGLAARVPPRLGSRASVMNTGSVNAQGAEMAAVARAARRHAGHGRCGNRRRRERGIRGPRHQGPDPRHPGDEPDRGEAVPRLPILRPQLHPAGRPQTTVEGHLQAAPHAAPQGHQPPHRVLHERLRRVHQPQPQ